MKLHAIAYLLPDFRSWLSGTAMTVAGCLSFVAWSSPAYAQQPEAFALTAPVPPLTIYQEGEDWLVPDLTHREIARQAVLIIARDEFGLATRDSVLREPMPEDTDSPDFFDIEVTHCQGSYVAYRLLRGGELIHEGQADYFLGEQDSVWAIANTMHAQTRGPLVESLKAAGLEHRPMELNLDGGGTTDGMMRSLSRMDIVSQYTAVRLAHEAMREHGETRDLLGVLVRGYANLSQLTAYHADSARYAFATRAVMYSTRLIMLEPESPNGHWHRAYASGVYGLTQSALWDLANAVQKQEAMDDPPATPMWVELVELGAKYRYSDLEQRVNADAGDLRQLAALLWFRSAEFAGNDRITIEAGKVVRLELPYCLRINNGIARVDGARNGYAVSNEPFDIADLSIPIALRRAAEDAGGAEGSLSRLSADASRAETLIGRSHLADSLMRDSGVSDDKTEPSMAVLGMLLDEMDFVLIARRASFMRDQWGVDTEDYLDQVAPAVAGHPHERLLQTLRLIPGRDADRFADYLSEYYPAEGNVYTTQLDMLHRIPREQAMADGTTIRQWLAQTYYFCAATDLEYMPRVWGADVETKIQFANWMAGIHPYSPWRFTILIRHDWENVKEKIDAWDKEHGHHPVVAYALAGRYERLGRPDDAIRLYNRYKDVAPDRDVHYRLATVSWGDGDRDQAVTYIREFLDQEEYFHEHANMAQSLALSFMAEGDYDLAEPWAERAADSGAAWAMLTLVNVYEHTGRFDEARSLTERIDDRHEHMTMADLAIRIDNDVDAARAIDREFSKLHFGIGSEEYRLIEPLYTLVEGDYDTAVDLWTELFIDGDFPFQCCMTGALALANGDEDTFLLMFQDAAGRDLEQTDESQHNYVRFARALLAAHTAGEVPDDLGDRICDDVYDPDNTNFNFFIACWHENQGDTDHAAVFYRKCAGYSNRTRRTTLRAFVRLRELGEDPYDAPVNWEGFQRYDIRP